IFHLFFKGLAFAPHEEIEDEIYFDDNADFGHISTVCYSSTPTSWNDECVQNAGPEIISKCIYAYGNIPRYKKYGRLHDLFKSDGNMTYLSEKNFTEICLKEIFDRCHYDAMFQIRMNSKQTVGVNLNPDFTKEFEVDTCGSETVFQVITQIKSCHQHDLLLPITSQQFYQSNDLACSLLADAAFCVEDHTAYSCIFNDRRLFKEMMQKLMAQLKEYSLQRLQYLEGAGVSNINNTMICLNCLDYYKAENCEEDFYQYILCLRNGSLHRKLYM
ncbi:uncharacterized protein TNCT_306821, partial [Trichonephila clavata]